jgi:hypothetical protein
MCERTAWNVWKRLEPKQVAERILLEKYPGLTETPNIVNAILDRINTMPSREGPLDEEAIKDHIKREAWLELQKIVREVDRLPPPT